MPARAARPFPIDAVRARFPALAVTSAGRPRIYLDAPGGTQMCADAIDAMVAHMREGTSNVGGPYETSRASEALCHAAHAAVADLIGGSADEIAFGPNMTSLTLAVSRALALHWAPGDEIVVTRLDHDANVAPWLRVAADRGMVVRWLDFDPASGMLRIEDLAGLLGPRTRLVAVGGASNALGTVNDLAAIVPIVRRHSPALIYVDAVQSVPHLVTDVAAIGCDLLAFSPYKFFGPHQGVLWGRADLLATLDAYKVRPAPVMPPAVRFESGTPSFEGQAGVLGMIAYLDALGAMIDPAATTRRQRLVAAMQGSMAYEADLATRLRDGLLADPRITLYGPTGIDRRVPTFAFTLDGIAPVAVAERLGAQAIFAGAGSFYAVGALGGIGLLDRGGIVRVGLCHYNRMDEVDTLLAALADL
jgi:cysteine desulfurase family protein (TIGR01976 family)